jgi:hypothetical protein
MQLAYLNHRSAIAAQEKEKERAQEREREEFAEFQRQNRLKAEADALGISVNELVARREDEAQEAARLARKRAFDKAMARIVANAIPVNRDELQDGVFYVARTGQLFQVRLEDQDELLACKAQN